MIRLAKGVPPQVLLDRGSEWTAEYLASLATGGSVPPTIRFRYRSAEVKTALRLEAHGKCIYCETKVSTGETDHIEPVSECPDRICDWANLGLACKECNANKSNYYAPAEPLINPFNDDPAECLLFFGPMVLPRAGDLKGLRSTRQLKLSRTDLLQRRVDRIQRLQPLVDQWHAQPPGATKELLRSALIQEAADECEYAATVRSYLLQQLGWTVPPGPAPMPKAA